MTTNPEAMVKVARFVKPEYKWKKFQFGAIHRLGKIYPKAIMFDPINNISDKWALWLALAKERITIQKFAIGWRVIRYDYDVAGYYMNGVGPQEFNTPEDAMIAAALAIVEEI